MGGGCRGWLSSISTIRIRSSPLPSSCVCLIDQYQLGWERAWKITNATFASTQHTLLPEALEKWPVWLMQSVLPRHLEIIYEINRRFLDEVRMTYPNDAGPCRAHVDHRRGGRKTGAHGEPGLHRQLFDQRRCRAAVRSPEIARIHRLRRYVARKVRQQNQRSDAAPVHAPGQPHPGRSHQPAYRRRLADQPGRIGAVGGLRRRQRVSRRLARYEDCEQAAAG